MRLSCAIAKDLFRYWGKPLRDWSLLPKADKAASPFEQSSDGNHIELFEARQLMSAASPMPEINVPSSDAGLSACFAAQIANPSATPQSQPAESPTITQPITATPNPVTGKSTALSVQATSSQGSLTYSWSTLSAPSGAVGPAFSVNGTTSANNTTATFSHAGTYQLRVTISDPVGNSITSQIQVQVNQTISSITVSSPNTTLLIGQAVQFSATAFDQFGQPMATQPNFSWSSSAFGGLLGSLFTPLLLGTQTVTATADGISGSSTVNAVAGSTAAASPSTVTGTTTTLSVIGGSTFGTTYTWSVLSKPAGAANPTYSQNADSAAQTTTATFYAAGNYTFQVAINFLFTTTQTVAVTVAPTVSSIHVTPAVTTLQEKGQTTFSAVAHDQFGTVIANQPTFSWIVESGSGVINQAGVFTAPGSGLAGSQTIAAQVNHVTGTSQINVVNAAPTIATAAAASPNPVTGNSTALSVLGADDGGASNLTYSWIATGTSPAPVIFTINGTNAAASTTAEFTKAGAYNLQVTVTDVEGLTTTSSVSVTVNQTLSKIVVAPATATLAINQTEQFSAVAYDQFGNALTSQPAFSWAVVSGTGSVDGSGLFTASGTAGLASVTASAASVSGSASIAVNGGVNADQFPAPQTTVENVPLTFSSLLGNAIVAGSSVTQVGLSVSGGILTLSTTAGLTFINGTANGSFSVQFSGTLAAMNAALNGLVFTPTQYLTGADPLTFVTGVTVGGNPTVFTTNTIPVTVTPAAPTIQTAAAANPAPVTGTTCALTVLGADDSGESNLTYIWTTTGNPPAPVAFAINGTNAAKDTTAIFSKAGTYSFQVEVVNTSGLSVLSTVSVTVSQTLKTLTISPGSVTVAEGASQAFAVTATDQFGIAMATPALTWAVASGAGTIDSTGQFTAATTSGSVTVSASSGGVAAQASITVPNTPPVVVNATSAGIISNTSASLSVLATDDNGEASLNYTWTATGPAGVIFQTNGTNAAKNTIAVFTAPGTYDLTATITDAEGLSTTSNVTLVVTPTLSSIAITAPSNSVHRGGSLQLTATGYDQFGGVMLATPTFAWSVSSGVGSVDSTGVYTAPNMGNGAVAIVAASGGLAATIGFNIVNELSETLPASQATISTRPLVFADGNSISITDADSSTSNVPVSITVSATGGSLTLTEEVIPTLGDSAGGNSTLDLTGTVAELNAELQGMTFTPNSGFHGFGAVTVAIDEVGTQQAPSLSVPILVQAPPAPVNPVVPPKPPVVVPVQPSPPPVTPISTGAGNSVNVLPAITPEVDAPDATASTQLSITTTTIASAIVTTGDVPAAPLPAAAPVIAAAANANAPAVQAPPAPKETPAPAKSAESPPVAAAAAPRAAPPPAAPPATVPDTLVQTDPGKVFTFLAPRSAMVQQLDQLKQEANSKPLTTVRIIAGSATFASIGVSAAYLLWLIRGGSLLFSMLSFFPAWRSIDPLPVLDNFESRKRRKARIDGDAESLESLIDNSKPTSADEPCDPPPIRLKHPEVSRRKAA